ncbi:MAG: hypothetical protein ACKV2V_19450, partial [Blastocatellia bacterium]
RALYVAARRGYDVPASALAATGAWLATPARWDENKGDPGFSDKRLAAAQFAAALLAAHENGQPVAPAALAQAARKLAAAQTPDGAWPIDQGTTLGSPATWGTSLATWMALRLLRAAALPETNTAARRAALYLTRLEANNVMNAAVIWLALARDRGARRQRAAAWRMLRRAQTRDGGWGPYADAPPETFDTALVLLALDAARQAGMKDGMREMIARGRRFLIAGQTADGSWPATTRPSGGDSYAQMMSTTAWATLALLATEQTGN